MGKLRPFLKIIFISKDFTKYFMFPPVFLAPVHMASCCPADPSYPARADNRSLPLTVSDAPGAAKG